MSPLNQEQISALIQFIEQAEDPGVITNVIVAAVLNWLYDKANDLSNKTDKDLITGALAYSQAPQIVLKSMGETLDGKHLSVAPIGIIYNETTKHIQKRTSINGETKTDDLGTPVGSLIYCNANTNKLYRWTGSAWSQVGENSVSDAQTQGYINRIQEKFDALIDALANYAFINGKDASMKIGTLEWDGATPEPTPVEEPVLTSPTNGGSVNIGSHSGSGVSKVVVIKGAYLTKPLTIAVNGQWFSVSSQSVTASDANIGTSVTVTYSGTSEIATGTLTISSDELDPITIRLSASYSEVVVPELTQPADGASVDVGTVSASGTSVTKRVTIQGSNLTQPLTIGVSGTGFTVSPSTVNAADANQGTTVTVTYTNESTVQTMLTATGQLTISSDEVNRTVGLTARKEAQQEELDYVTDGLVLHLDGKSQGGTTGKWIDKIANREFDFTESGVSADTNGVTFDGDPTSGALFNDVFNTDNDATTDDFPHFTEGTIEVAFTFNSAPSNNVPLFVTNKNQDICLVLLPKSGRVCFVVNDTTNNYYGTTAAIESLINTTGTHIISVTKPSGENNENNADYRVMVDGVAYEKTDAIRAASAANNASGAGRLRVGSQSNAHTITSRGCDATIHAVRVYNKHLIESQMLNNQKKDNQYYNLGLTING